MNVFLIGMPQSGRTTVGKAIDSFSYVHISDNLNILAPFKSEEKHSFILDSLRLNPNICIDECKYDLINNFYIVDGIISPRDFITLFDYNKDVVVFLNRMDHQPEYQDYQNIALAVMRDYCFWLSSANLLPKRRWLEFNFKTIGDYDPYLKQMGYKNSVFSVKTLNSVIVNLKLLLTELLEPGDNTQENMHEM